MDEKETFGSRKNRTPFPKLFEIYFCLKKGLSFVQGKIYDFGDRLSDIKLLLQLTRRLFSNPTTSQKQRNLSESNFYDRN